MKNKLFLMLVIPLSCAFAASSSDNYFCPTRGSISFKVDQYTVTSSQAKTWEGVNTVDSELEYQIEPTPTDGWTAYKESVTCLDVKVGRKGDTDNATKANNLSQSFTGVSVTSDTVLATIYANSHKTIPDELNFAMAGTLTIATYYNNSGADNTYDCPNVIIGQGHFSGNNNWWIYNNAPGFGKNQLLCTRRSDGSSAVFQVLQAPDNPATPDFEGIGFSNVGPAKASTYIYDYIISFNLYYIF